MAGFSADFIFSNFRIWINMVAVNIVRHQVREQNSACSRNCSGKQSVFVPGASHSVLKKSILLVAALAQFSSVLFTSAAMAQTASTVAATALPTGGVVKAGSATINGGGTAGNTTG
ncbi:MAG: hypothetical protein EBS72_09645, partial [Rhizobiales bacterium]|nr:hypothetical protein [Hyphomicrobiales bacterium]